jgi:uncharacterized protein (DUF2267 family)
MQNQETTQSWSGLGVGTDRQSFLMKVAEQLPDYEPERAEDFYLHVANHLNADPENVRLVLHGVFAALHTQITESESEKISSQLPDYVKGTWRESRRGVDRPY